MSQSSVARSINAPLASIDGWSITTPTLDSAVGEIIERAGRAESFTVFTLNLDHVVKLRRDAAFRAAYRSASVVTADGAPIVWLSRRQGANLTRTTGADLVLPLVDAAAAHQIPIYLYGSTGATLAKAARSFVDRSDGLIDIAGSDSPSANFDPNGPKRTPPLPASPPPAPASRCIALGAPKQEVFAARAKAQGLRCGFVCIGAALDFIAGDQIRAPKLMQRTGTEWLWRLATNPRRLAGRYADCALLLADLAVIKPIRARIVGH